MFQEPKNPKYSQNTAYMSSHCFFNAMLLNKNRHICNVRHCPQVQGSF